MAGAVSARTQAVLDDPAFPIVKAQVLQRTGLAYYADKDSALAERLARRLEERGVARLTEYLTLLPAAAEFQALVNELAVGETFFFRYIEQFEALRAVAIPECLRRNRARRTLRIWSAGCATGPEVYTLEILLKQNFGAELEGWQVTLLGTDLNRAFLDQARRASYSHWAVRGLPEDVLSAYFVHHQQSWQVRPEYREWATFEVFNLVEGRLPDPARGLAAFDIVLCRNVMIYFDEPTRARLLRGLRDTLVDGGWLVVGHAETGAEIGAVFTPVPVPGATLYRKPDPLCRAAEPPRLPLPAQPLPPPEPEPPRRRAAKPHAAKPAEPPPPAVPTLTDVEELAERGECVAALDACLELVEHDRFNAAAHFRLGQLEDEAGAGDPVAAFRRALYLEPDFALADYHLALAYWRRGKLGPAQRHFRNARDGLAKHADEELVAHGRGLTVGELRRMIALWLSGDEARG
ncbi:MAG TPA: CheR family methyltransferase [Azospirillum sp.]|nr:CheR family methyltransferase [Azospirillum sp.]